MAQFAASSRRIEARISAGRSATRQAGLKSGPCPDLRTGEEIRNQDGVGAQVFCFLSRWPPQQGVILASLVRWHSPAEALAMATAGNALLALSGSRNPYPGKLGVVEPGTLADLLLIEGNPLENIDVISDPSWNFKVIMKDGRVYKNAL
jgi:hypothetical protein